MRPSVETHVFIVWPWAKRRRKIQRYIRNKFFVLDEFEFTWPDFGQGLAEFYGMQGRMDVEPKGEAVAYVARVPFVRAGRPTSTGFREVNPYVFDAKQELRRLGEKSGPLNSVHASDNPEEAASNLFHIVNRFDSLPDALAQIPGPYVVLRNFRGEPDHSDIDILVEDLDATVSALGGVRIDGYNMIPPDAENVKYKYVVRIGDNLSVLDLRHVGDGYLDERWQRQVLENRVQERGLYRPSDHDWYWTLLYHALVHKGTTEKYESVLSSLGDGPHDMQKLVAYMDQRRYEFTQPDDPFVVLFGVVLGRVDEGKGIASTSPQPGLKEKWLEGCGYEPFPGTLNVKYWGRFQLPQPSHVSTIAELNVGTGAVESGPLHFWPATISGEPCTLTMGGNLPNQVEVLAPVNLRETLGLETGDEVVVVLDA